MYWENFERQFHDARVVSRELPHLTGINIDAANMGLQVYGVGLLQTQHRQIVPHLSLLWLFAQQLLEIDPTGTAHARGSGATSSGYGPSRPSRTALRQHRSSQREIPVLPSRVRQKMLKMVHDRIECMQIDSLMIANLLGGLQDSLCDADSMRDADAADFRSSDTEHS